MNITFGLDPEFVLTRNNKPVSAIPVIKRSKHDRIDLDKGFNYYYDNALLEANVAPATSKGEAVLNIGKLFNLIYKTLKPGYDIKTQASAVFTKEECQHPEAMRAGCSEEYCAYDVCACQPPEFTDGTRSAGGHIHLGRTDYKAPSDDFLIDDFSKMDVIKAMDIFVGLPSVLMDSSEPSKTRKTLYGRAGRHRPTPYGVEYRTLSNFWMSSPELVDLVYTLTMHAVATVRENGVPEVDFEKVRSAIDNNDFELANELCISYIPNNLMERIKQFVNWNNFDIKGNWKIEHNA